MTHQRDRTLVASGLARVEGEGAMHVRVRGGQVDEVRLDIYEPPRFFEAFLRGRSDLGQGPGLSRAVAAAIDALAGAVLRDLTSGQICQGTERPGSSARSALPVPGTPWCNGE